MDNNNILSLLLRWYQCHHPHPYNNRCNSNQRFRLILVKPPLLHKCKCSLNSRCSLLNSRCSLLNSIRCNSSLHFRLILIKLLLLHSSSRCKFNLLNSRKDLLMFHQRNKLNRRRHKYSLNYKIMLHREEDLPTFRNNSLNKCNRLLWAYQVVCKEET